MTRHDLARALRDAAHACRVSAFPRRILGLRDADTLDKTADELDQLAERVEAGSSLTG
jgi:hypothetical protein